MFLQLCSVFALENCITDPNMKSPGFACIYKLKARTEKALNFIQARFHTRLQFLSLYFCFPRLVIG